MPQVETLILANHAEAVNGLLYIAGGGWTDHWRPPMPEGQVPISSLGIGVGILVPWGETNRKHTITLRIESEDGGPQLTQLEGEIEVGRPPGIPDGIDQRAVLGINFNLQFPAAGGYRIVAECRESTRSVSFRVHDSGPPNLRAVGT